MPHRYLMATWTTHAALFYTFAGYPAIMAAWSRLAPRHSTRPAVGALPSVTVIVPAHNEADVIASKLRTVRCLDYPASLLEAVVVDDGSTDDTSSAAEAVAWASLTILRLPERRGKVNAINSAIDRSSGEIIVLTDASALLDSGAVAAAVDRFLDPSIGAVSGAIRIRDTASGVVAPAALYWCYQERLRYWESLSGSTVGVNGNFFAFRRELYERLSESTINDEFTIALRIALGGRTVVYEPAVVTYDDASATMSEEKARRSRISAGRVQAVRSLARPLLRDPGLLFRLSSHKLTRSVAPVLLVASGLSAVGHTASQLGPRPLRRFSVISAARLEGWWSFAAVAPHVSLWLAASWAAVLERRGRPIPKALAIPYFFASANLAGLTGLKRSLFQQQSALWAKRSPVQREPPTAS